MAGLSRSFSTLICMHTLQDRTNRKQSLDLLNLHLLYLLVRRADVSGLEALFLWDSLWFHSPSVGSAPRLMLLVSTGSVWGWASFFLSTVWKNLFLPMSPGTLSTWVFSTQVGIGPWTHQWSRGWSCHGLLPPCRAWLLECQTPCLQCILKANLFSKRALERMPFRFTSYMTRKTHIISNIQTCQTSLQNTDPTHAKMSANSHISLTILAILDLLPFFVFLLFFLLVFFPPLSLILQPWLPFKKNNTLFWEKWHGGRFFCIGFFKALEKWLASLLSWKSHLVAIKGQSQGPSDFRAQVLTFHKLYHTRIINNKISKGYHKEGGCFWPSWRSHDGVTFSSKSLGFPVLLWIRLLWN